MYYRVPLSSFMPAMWEVKNFYKCAIHADIYIIQDISVPAKALQAELFENFKNWRESEVV